MNEVKLANCHCIISHLSKPKFMAIEHSTGWMPPVIKFPASGFVGNKAKMITDGVMRKYGLKVTLLRHLVESADYHCIELEQQSTQSSRKLNAVWVGSKEYAKFRTSRPGQADPFADWLKDAEKGWVSPKRPAWERKRWFGRATNWMEHELDRRNIQVTGSVQQQTVFWPAHTFLRVKTAQAMFSFKASYPAAPNEAELTLDLAQRWPDLVAQPVAFDVSKNWLLMRDFQADSNSSTGSVDYPAIARKFAGLQVASAAEPRKWNELGVPSLDSTELDRFLNGLDALNAILRSAEQGLDETELEQLPRCVPALLEAWSRLQEYAVPAGLVHPEFFPENIVSDEGHLKLINWSDVMLSHPFFSALQLERSLRTQAVDFTDVKDAYLTPFTGFEPMDRLKQCFDLADRLLPAWQLYRWSRQLEHIEPDSVAYFAKARVMQRICRTLISRHESS
jgi:hypothetical protein